jgi:hypothetical protein
MKATQQQINIIANVVNTDDDGAGRSASTHLAHRLFPESRFDIDDTITSHPINVRWAEYCVLPCIGPKRKEFLLPE